MCAVRDGDSEYIRIATAAEQDINKLNTNSAPPCSEANISLVISLQKIVDLMGTPRDTPELQRQYQQLQETMKKQIMQIERSIKQACLEYEHENYDIVNVFFPRAR